MESAPTGCFKCGRPGHWSRDCPSSAPVAGNPASSSSTPSQTPNNDSQISSFPKSARSSIAPVPKSTKARVQRPKLTPEMLLSEDGLGYVLRYFPRSFKYRGRGKEACRFPHFILSSNSLLLLIFFAAFSAFHRFASVNFDEIGDKSDMALNFF